MPNFNRHIGPLVALLALVGHAGYAQAQQQPQGFAVERFYRSAPGGGWFVMDSLDMHGGWGGTLALNVGYARDPLVLRDSSQHLAVVSHQASAAVGAAVTYSRFRLYLDLDFPLVVSGNRGQVGDYSFIGPSVTIASNPDTLSDARIGLDLRIVGGPQSRFRFGAGAQLLVPSGSRADYLTDGTFRGMARLLFAGDVGRFTYAGHLGVHVRPLDDAPTPGSPRGTELLVGVAGGARLPLGLRGSWAIIVGPEIYGATSFRSFFSLNETALEGLVSGRLEGTADSGFQLRVKLGAGAGMTERFGAPTWRVVFAIEVFNHNQPPLKTGVPVH